MKEVTWDTVRPGRRLRLQHEWIKAVRAGKTMLGCEEWVNQLLEEPKELTNYDILNLFRIYAGVEDADKGDDREEELEEALEEFYRDIRDSMQKILRDGLQGEHGYQLISSWLESLDDYVANNYLS